MNKLAVILPLGAAFVLGSGAAWAKSVPVHASLAPIAHTHSKGSGTLTGSFDTGTEEFSWKVVYTKLSGQITSARIHGPSRPGQDAPVLLSLPPPLGTPILGVVDMSRKAAAAVTGGKAYFVISTKANIAGELRGRIMPGP
jgi:hypothetical protein